VATLSREVRRWIAEDVAGMPLPGLMAAMNKPVAYAMGRHVGVSAERIRSDLNELPALLGRIEELIDCGTLGGETANAADLQIFCSIRSLQTFTDLAPVLAGSAASELAPRFLPELPGPVPPALPAAWLPSSSNRLSGR
jgi:hypothetical protein